MTKNISGQTRWAGILRLWPWCLAGFLLWVFGFVGCAVFSAYIDTRPAVVDR